MKKITGICLIIVGICCSGYVLVSIAQQRVKRPIIVSTSGLDVYKDQSLEVRGIISVSTGEAGEDVIDRLADRLKTEAERLGADAVIDVRYILYQGRLYAYGTAIRMK